MKILTENKKMERIRNKYSHQMRLFMVSFFACVMLAVIAVPTADVFADTLADTETVRVGYYENEVFHLDSSVVGSSTI